MALSVDEGWDVVGALRRLRSEEFSGFSESCLARNVWRFMSLKRRPSVWSVGLFCRYQWERSENPG